MISPTRSPHRAHDRPVPTRLTPPPPLPCRRKHCPFLLEQPPYQPTDLSVALAQQIGDYFVYKPLSISLPSPTGQVAWKQKIRESSTLKGCYSEVLIAIQMSNVKLIKLSSGKMVQRYQIFASDRSSSSILNFKLKFIWFHQP